MAYRSVHVFKYDSRNKVKSPRDVQRDRVV